MGRRRHSKHGQKRHSQRSKRRAGRSQPLPRAHGSDPEGGGREAITDSPLWNSLDELSVAGPSPPPSLSALVAADYVYKSGLSSDEMEVTRKLSCLNFSMLPCSGADAALMLSHRPDHTGTECHHHHRHNFQDGVLSVPGDESLNRHAADMSDVEPYCELPSATQLNVLLPTLEQQGEDGRRIEAMDCEQRRRRKRASRKRPNRRTKKMRLHHHTDISPTSATNPTGKTTVQPLVSSFVHSAFSDGKDKELSRGHLRRTRSFRRSRRQSRPEQRDPMLCILSDTSAICEFDQDKATNGEMVDEDFFDTTPPAEGIPPMDMMMEGLGCIGGPAVSLEELPNESDLTETTSDSGCEGDDEESSVEGPSGRGHNLPGWWDKEESSSSEEDEKFTQILTNSFPLMSKEGQSKFQQHNLSEFKHPARFGITGKGGRKKRSKPMPSSGSLTLNEVSQKLTSFVQKEGETELQFGLVSRAMCRTIACLARVFNLECVIEQKRRLPVANPLLRKTVLTRVATRQEIEPILRNHGRESPTMLLKETCMREHAFFPGDTRERDNLTKERSFSSHKGLSSEYAVVGGKATPLNETNIGNRILQGMGWSPGTGLGPSGMGIKDPVLAYIRPRHVGLGY